jgi:hypothetical protein
LGGGGASGGLGGLGGGAGLGGQGGSGGTDCKALLADYASKFLAARSCDPQQTNQCSKDSSLPDPTCGKCSLLVAKGTQATTDAKSALSAFLNAPCAFAACSSLCLDLSLGAGCNKDSASGDFLCTPKLLGSTG